VALALDLLDTVEMPDRMAENLLACIRQNNGTLSEAAPPRRVQGAPRQRGRDAGEDRGDAFEGVAGDPTLTAGLVPAK
jgi:hypothetical protein